MDYSKLNRINVIGTSGSGKSTLAKEISTILKMPYIEMDLLYWKRDWTEPSDEEFFEKLSNALSGSSWVLDGNYKRTTEIKWQKVETIIWVDYSKIRTIFQAIKRAILRIISNKELWPNTNNKESFKQSFLSKKSIILWTLSTYDKNKCSYEAMMKDPKYSHLQFIRISNNKEKRQFLNKLKSLRTKNYIE